MTETRLKYARDANFNFKFNKLISCISVAQSLCNDNFIKLRKININLKMSM